MTNGAESGRFRIGGAFDVNRLGYGAMRIAPKPRRLTSKAPPMRTRPDSAALIMLDLREFFA